MIVLKTGKINWKPGNLNLTGWHFDLEGEEYTDNGFRRAMAICAIECMLDNVGVNFGDATMPFEVERIASDVIFSAAVTSSPSMMREYEKSQKRSLWVRLTDWWLR